ncbi:hypothetical protein JHK86_001574 [Glycine max]|nr:hypothetical protein JHK86_001574 [Glycine max]
MAGYLLIVEASLCKKTLPRVLSSLVPSIILSSSSLLVPGAFRFCWWRYTHILSYHISFPQLNWYVVKALEREFLSDSVAVKLPWHLKQNIIDEILQRLRSLNSSRTDIAKERGHGGSDGLHGYVPSLDHVVVDTAASHPHIEVMVEGIILTSPALRVKPAHPIVGVNFAFVSCA